MNMHINIVFQECTLVKPFPKRNQEIVETEAKSKLRTDMTAYFPDLEYAL
jgi:hypothetical protein